MNREEVLEKLQPMQNMKVRQVTVQPRTRVNFTPEIVTIRPGSGGAIIPVSKEGLAALEKFVGAPGSLEKKLTADLYGRILTELLYRTERFNVIMANDQAINFTPHRGVRSIPVERVLNNN